MKFNWVEQVLNIEVLVHPGYPVVCMEVTRLETDPLLGLLFCEFGTSFKCIQKKEKAFKFKLSLYLEKLDVKHL